ncbi:MAG: DinB family protein [Vicinamibacterales bacterium]
MTLDELRELLNYHYWARDRVLSAAGALTQEQYLRDLGSSFRSVRDTLVHTFGAEWNWYQRWQGISPTSLLPFDDYPDVDSLRTAWTAHEAKVRAFVEQQGGAAVDQVFEYRSLGGIPSASRFGHMVQHVVNHATYHRGQVTTMLRQLGASPPKAMDLIAYYREMGSRI